MEESCSVNNLPIENKDDTSAFQLRDAACQYLKDNQGTTDLGNLFYATSVAALIVDGCKVRKDLGFLPCVVCEHLPHIFFDTRKPCR